MVPPVYFIPRALSKMYNHGAKGTASLVVPGTVKVSKEKS